MKGAKWNPFYSVEEETNRPTILAFAALDTSLFHEQQSWLDQAQRQLVSEFSSVSATSKPNSAKLASDRARR